jgi:hypothetical protein
MPENTFTVNFAVNITEYEGRYRPVRMVHFEVIDDETVEFEVEAM